MNRRIAFNYPVYSYLGVKRHDLNISLLQTKTKLLVSSVVVPFKTIQKSGMVLECPAQLPPKRHRCEPKAVRRALVAS